jgi:hypothetical protein
VPVFESAKTGYESAMDLLDVLRRQAGRFQCPNCQKSLANCELDLVASADDQSLVKVTCAHCQDSRLIAVAFATEVESAPIDVRDEPVEALGDPISADDVLDVRLALAGFDGDLRSLLS